MSMDKLIGFAKLTKMDETKQEVWGVLAEEAIDKDGEIMDYASSKPNFEAWSEGFAKATDGKSYGNLRAMHTKIAAGKIIHMEFRDEEKQVYIGAKVIDNEEWQKCKEAVYTGFSIGGDYARTWKDASGNRRYTAKPFEASLVDNPCAYGAQFEYVKMDGSSEMRKFKTSPEDKNMDLKKGLCEVVDLVSVIAQLNAIQENCQLEAQLEGDGSAVPAQLLDATKGLAAILQSMVAEETAELTSDPIEAEVMEMAVKVDVEKAAGEAAPEVKPEPVVEKTPTEQPLQKAELEKASLEKFEGRIISLEKTAGDNHAETLKLQKALADQNENMTKMILERDTQVAKLNGDLTELNKAIQEMTKRLVPARTVLKGAVVNKEEDGLEKAAPAAIKDPLEAIKAIHQHGKAAF